MVAKEKSFSNLVLGKTQINRDADNIGGIVIEASPEKLVIARSVYSILNLIVDLGGLSIGMFFLFKLINLLFKCSSPEGRLIKNLFKA